MQVDYVFCGIQGILAQGIVEYGDEEMNGRLFELLREKEVSEDLKRKIVYAQRYRPDIARAKKELLAYKASVDSDVLRNDMAESVTELNRRSARNR